MSRENKIMSEEFGMSSESEAVKEYLRMNRDTMYSNYPLIADEIIMRPNQKMSCILDIGTGLGSLAREFAKRLPACRVYGIDISGEMLTEAHMINKSEGISNLTLMLSDMNHIAFEDNVFDVIVSFGALHHLSTITKAISEIRRVLKERGEAFLYDVRKNPPQDVVTEIADGMSSFHKRAFLESVKEGLDVSYIETIVQGLGFTRYSLSYPTYSRATVVKNKSILQTFRFLGKRFNQLFVMIYLQK